MQNFPEGRQPEAGANLLFDQSLRNTAWSAIDNWQEEGIRTRTGETEIYKID